MSNLPRGFLTNQWRVESEGITALGLTSPATSLARTKNLFRVSSFRWPIVPSSRRVVAKVPPQTSAVTSWTPESPSLLSRGTTSETSLTFPGTEIQREESRSEEHTSELQPPYL